MVDKLIRKPISDKAIRDATDSVIHKIIERLAKKGRGSVASVHEVWGAVDEEMQEFKDAVRENDLPAAERELRDIAVGAIFAIACIMDEGIK